MLGYDEYLVFDEPEDEDDIYHYGITGVNKEILDIITNNIPSIILRRQKRAA